jgi:hypothetical protein
MEGRILIMVVGKVDSSVRYGFSGLRDCVFVR